MTIVYAPRHKTRSTPAYAAAPVATAAPASRAELPAPNETEAIRIAREWGLDPDAAAHLILWRPGDQYLRPEVWLRIMKLQGLERRVLLRHSDMRAWLTTSGKDGRPPLQIILLDPNGLDRLTEAMRP